MVRWGCWKVMVCKIVFGYTSPVDNWNSLFEFVRMVNIVGFYAVAQSGLSKKWRAIAEEDEFWLLGATVWPEVFVQIFVGLCWFIRISNLWVVWPMQQTSHLHENLWIRGLFWKTVTLSLRLRGNSTSDLRMTHNLTELKQRLTDLLIRSSSYIADHR